MKKGLAIAVAMILFASCVLFAQGAKEAPAAAATEGGVKEITMWYQENKTMIPAFDARVAAFNEKYAGKDHLTITYIPRGTSYA